MINGAEIKRADQRNAERKWKKIERKWKKMKENERKWQKKERKKKKANMDDAKTTLRMWNIPYDNSDNCFGNY